MIEHNSQIGFYREPFGAIKTNKEIRLRIMVDKGMWPVRLHYFINGQLYVKEMKYMYVLGEHDIYEVTFKTPCNPCVIWYHFVIKENIYYGNNEKVLGGKGQVYHDHCHHNFQITVYNDAKQIPRWLMNGVMYQIMVDRFYNPTPKIRSTRTDIHNREWGELPYHRIEQFGDDYLCNDFYGGNLQGVIAKLPYLQKIGVTVLYLNPIFEAYSNHKYDTANFEKIDPDFGTIDDFKQLCNTAKALGIRVILDAVFSHTGSDSIYFNKKGKYDSLGAYQSKESPYYSWYQFYDYPNGYESWWGIDTLPAINKHSESYKKYILTNPDAIVKRWLEAGASGWRFDVIDELPNEFIDTMYKQVKTNFPNAAIIGEVWEDASKKEAYGEQKEYFCLPRLDGVMNYVFKDALIAFATNNMNAWDFNATIMSIVENYPYPHLLASMNFLSSHDVERIITRLASVPLDLPRTRQATYVVSAEKQLLARQRLRALLPLWISMPGIISIYYGDEVGVDGFRDPFNRKTFPWNDIDESILGIYLQVLKIKKTHAALRTGSFRTVCFVNQTFGCIRENDQEIVITVTNFGEHRQDFFVDLKEKLHGEALLDINKIAMYTDKISDTIPGLTSFMYIFYKDQK